MSHPSQDAVAAANARFYLALTARDLAMMESVWAHEDDATCIHPGWRLLAGWMQIRMAWNAIFDNTADWNVACDRVRIRMAPDMAWLTCVEIIRPAEPGDQVAVMQATNVFVLRGDRWLMIHHHASSSPADEVAAPQSVN